MNKYAVQVKRNDQWVVVTVGAMGFCQGYFECLRGETPRSEMRVVKLFEGRAWFDGRDIEESDIQKVVGHDKGNVDVGIGLIAGWPTAEQYERAAEKALDKAKEIRSRNSGPVKLVRDYK